jgi:plasmid replication initiation protein
MILINDYILLIDNIFNIFKKRLLEFILNKSNNITDISIVKTTNK